MFAPVLFVTIVLAACLVTFTHAGGYYFPDHPTTSVTPGGYGDWDDNSLSAGTIANSPNAGTLTEAKAKRRLRYNKKRSAIPEADSSGFPKRVRPSINVLSEDLRQPMIQASKSYSELKHDVLDRVNILATEATIKSTNEVTGKSNDMVGNLMAGDIIHGSEKTKRETGFQETPQTVGKTILVFHPDTVPKDANHSVTTADL